jgi:uncharacterized membrane protein YhhN
MQTKRYSVFMIVFLAIEIGLYGLILTTGGKTLIWSEYISIILCFAFALVHFRNPLMIGGLALTVCADYCLVVCDPIQQLWGMVFFLGAQILYAVMLHRQGLPRGLLIARLALSVAVEIVALLILRENTDLLALVSMCYYVNLILNMVCAFARFRNHRLLAIGFVLFILCDTVIGLQVAAGGYLPIPEDSLIYNIIFSGFHLSWFFYLPSQVLLAISAAKKK